MTISVKRLSKRFRDFTALEDISLTIKDGELIALLGPSGSGKTTLLRIIAGLEKPDSGEVVISPPPGGRQEGARNEAVSDNAPAPALPLWGREKERPVGFVFQHYALFKHMSVFDNVAFGLRVRPKKERLSEEEIGAKVMKLLKMVHLEALHGRYPSQLSGGQRQRVALARALAVEPKVLLLDEPFGALDAKVRKELRRWMRRLHEELNITSIFVTHDQEEAMEMADRVVVMSQGKIEQVGTPEEVYLQPANAFVYDFLGHYNEFSAWQMADGTLLLKDSEEGVAHEKEIAAPPTGEWMKLLPGLAQITRLLRPAVKETPKKKNPAARKKPSPGMGTPVKVFCRPHELFIEAQKEPGTVLATIIHINPAGSLVKLELERAVGTLLDAELPKAALDNLKLTRGQRVYVRPKEMKVFA